MTFAEMASPTLDFASVHAPDDVDSPDYTTRQVCGAAGVSPALVFNWICRDNPAISFSDGDFHDGAQGSARYWSFRRLMQVALTFRMANTFSIKPRRASLIAAGYTDVGSGGPGDPGAGGEIRLPGRLFQGGDTILIGGTDDVGRCVCATPEMPLAWVFHSMADRGNTAVIVHVNQVHRDVLFRMAAGA